MEPSGPNAERGSRRPPPKGRGLFSDIRTFFLHKPTVDTLIDVSAGHNRQDYSHRIRQRLGISAARFAILNIHKIGIDAPVWHVFEELLRWGEDSTCWPNHVARLERVGGRIEQMRILLFGRKRFPFGLGRGFVPLFNLQALRIQRVPESWDVDNARYLLFECKGGYPIGFFAMYVRSPIGEQGEVEPAQLFLVVGFNFYGRENRPVRSWVRRLWEMLHNRVTANVLMRFKRLCEWRFENLQQGRDPRRPRAGAASRGRRRASTERSPR